MDIIVVCTNTTSALNNKINKKILAFIYFANEI